MKPEVKKALQTVQDTDLSFPENSAEQSQLQDFQELAGEALVTESLGSDLTEAATTIKEGLVQLEQSIPEYIDEYLKDITHIAQKAERVVELITPGAEGNPQNEDWRDEEVANTLKEINVASEALLTTQLATISYFKNIIQRETRKLLTEIEFIASSHESGRELTQKDIQDLKEKLEVITQLPDTQPHKLEGQQESCNEEINRLVKSCNQIEGQE